MNGHFAENPDYEQYERLLIRVHELIASGQGDSEEADALRDRMEAPWRRLSDEEVERLDGLSADLYMLNDEEVPEKADPAERGPDTLGTALLEAQRRGDWAQVLHLLRKGPIFISKPTIAFLRGLGYLHLGQPRVGLLFLDYAAKVELPKLFGSHDDAARVAVS